MKNIISLALGLLLALCGTAPVTAQQFNAIPDRSVIGRIGTGSGSGPSQAISFTALVAQIGALNPTFGTPGQTAGQVCLASATSGTVCLKGATGALGSSVATLPAGTYNVVGDSSTQTLTNKTFDTAGTGNSFLIAGAAVTANTGTGSVVRATSPTLVTPTIGAATATSINGNTWTAGTGTLTLGAGKTLTASNSLTLAGTDGTTLTFQGTNTYVGRTTTDTLTNKTIDTTSNTVQVGGVTVAPGQYRGETSSGSATAGNIGEFVSSNVAQGSAVALTTGAIANITSISLTAGDWDIYGVVGFIPGGTTTITRWGGSIETANNIFSSIAPNSTIWSMGSFTPGANANLFNVGPLRVTLSATTSYYLNVVSTFATSTNAGFGFLRARRVR